MAFGNFGSAWREKAFYTENPEQLHVAAPEHAERQGDPDPVWHAPAQTNDSPEFLYDAQADDYVADNPGLVFDTTPYDHSDGGNFGISPTHVDAAAVNAQTAGRSYGADLQDNYSPPFVQDFTTKYIGRRFEGLPGTSVAPVALVRGLNSDEANNPEGFRRGWVEQTWTDRKMYDPERTHDRRYLTPNVVTVATDAPPVDTPFGSPFRALAKTFTSVSQSPMIRREPVGISESVTTDGSEQSYADDVTAGDWVAG